MVMTEELEPRPFPCFFRLISCKGITFIVFMQQAADHMVKLLPIVPSAHRVFLIIVAVTVKPENRSYFYLY